MKFTRNRGSKRLRARHGNGRFARPTMESAFGLRIFICAECRGIVTVPAGEPRPDTCHHCNKPLVDEREAKEAQR